MYKCAMCKKEFDGQAAWKNACGSFCAVCKATIHARAAEGAKEMAIVNLMHRLAVQNKTQMELKIDN